MLRVENKIVYFGKRKIGLITKDGKFITFRNEEKHLFRMYNGWGFNIELIKFLENIGVWIVEVRTKKAVYKILLDEINKHGIEYENKETGEKQIIVPLTFFKIFELEGLEKFVDTNQYA